MMIQVAFFALFAAIQQVQPQGKASATASASQQLVDPGARAALSNAQFLKVRPSGDRIGVFSSEAIAQVISIEDVAVGSGDDIKTMLRQRRFRPDGQALAFVYSLNPELRHLDSLKIGTKLRLPVADVRNAELGDDARIAIVVAPESQVGVREAANSIAVALQRIDAVPELASQRGQLAGFVANLKGEDFNSSVYTAAAVSTLSDAAKSASTSVSNAIQRPANTPQAIEAAKSDVEQLAGIMTALDNCSNTAEAGCSPELVFEPITAADRKRVSDVRLLWASEHSRFDASCTAPGPPCRNEFNTNWPDYRVRLFKYGTFYVWAMRGPQVVSCDKKISSPVSAATYSIDVFKDATEMDANCHPSGRGGSESTTDIPRAQP